MKDKKEIREECLNVGRKADKEIAKLKKEKEELLKGSKIAYSLRTITKAIEEIGEELPVEIIRLRKDNEWLIGAVKQANKTEKQLENRITELYNKNKRIRKETLEEVAKELTKKKDYVVDDWISPKFHYWLAEKIKEAKK